jgi:hypothetical protein
VLVGASRKRFLGTVRLMGPFGDLQSLV